MEVYRYGSFIIVDDGTGIRVFEKPKGKDVDTSILGKEVVCRKNKFSSTEIPPWIQRQSKISQLFPKRHVQNRHF